MMKLSTKNWKSKLQSLMWLPCLQSYPLLMGMTQLKHSMTKTMVHLGRENLAVTQTEEVLPIEETLEGDTMEVTRVTTGKEGTTGIEVDTIEAVDRDEATFMVEAMEVDTTIKEDVLGMETEIKVKMNDEIIMTIVTIEITMTIMRTESNVKTDNQIDKFYPDLQSFWTDLSWKTCRGGGYPCNQPPPLWSITGKYNEKD